MKNSTKWSSKLLVITLLVTITMGLQACKKDHAFGVNDEPVTPGIADKDKQKSEEQYIAILHANLFQRALSSNALFDITQLMLSIGDKELAHEVLISNFMNEPDVIYPTDSFMRNNIDSFMIETYERFLVRKPSEIELTFFRNFIATHPTVTAELVYFSFALSNEYLFY